MTKISDLTELLGAGVDQANDLIPIVDMSEAGAARNKKIKITQLLGLVTDIVGLLDFKGSTDCSANPNYPAASKGDYYLVSVAGKIGGASGIDVTAGDSYFALADNAGGTQAAVGTSWTVIQGNVTYAPVNKAGDTMTGDLIVPDEAYDATAWNGSLEVPTKNAIRDKIEAIVAGGGSFTAASTTEVLTGTDNAKGATPDSLAALWEQGSDVASSGTISIGEGGYFNITGTTTITDIDFGTDKAGRKAWVKFAGILTLTHNASTLILPTGASITTAAGDTACFVSEGSDVVRCVAYNRASGAALTGGSSGGWALAGAGQTATGVWDFAVDGAKANVDFTGLAGATEIMVVVRNVTKASSGITAMRVSVDNGSTFYSASGDYVIISAAGVESNQDFMIGFHGTATTAARSGICLVPAAAVAAPRPALSFLNTADTRLFVASNSAINAVRVLGAAGGNLTGGKVYCFTR